MFIVCNFNDSYIKPVSQIIFQLYWLPVNLGPEDALCRFNISDKTFFF